MCNLSGWEFQGLCLTCMFSNISVFSEIAFNFLGLSSCFLLLLLLKILSLWVSIIVLVSLFMNFFHVLLSILGFSKFPSSSSSSS